MCLRIDKELTKVALKNKKIHTNQMIKVWKVLGLSEGSKPFLISPYRVWFRWKPGWNKSSRISSKIASYEEFAGLIDVGMHVFLDKKSATNFKNSLEKIVPVYAYKKDFIAAGKDGLRNEAVFTKVFLKKEDYDKAISK